MSKPLYTCKPGDRIVQFSNGSRLLLYPDAPCWWQCARNAAIAFRKANRKRSEADRLTATISTAQGGEVVIDTRPAGAQEPNPPPPLISVCKAPPRTIERRAANET